MAETCTHHLPPFNKQRKRKRLSQVVDKLTTQVVKSSPPPTPPPSAALLNNNFHNKNHNLEPMLDHMLEPAETSPQVKSEVFRFDSVDRERYTYAAISEEEDVFSPRSSTASSPHVSSADKLPFSPRDSPFSPGDSPKVPFSPMCIKDGEAFKHGPSQPRYPGCSCAHCSPLEVTPMDRYFPGGVPPSPVSPLTPCTPSPINNFEHYLHSKYLPDIFRRRSHSDSDIPMWFEGAALSIKSEVGAGKGAGTFKNEPGTKGTRQKVPLTLPAKGGSLESETSTPQDSPLDLSVRGSRGSSSTSSVESVSRLRAPPLSSTPPTPPQDVTTSFLPRSLVPVPVVRGDVASPTTKESVAHRYNLEVSPVVEEMPPGSDVAYVCPVCGQMFSLHDRLAKHMASRHKTKQQADQTTKAYLCDVCQRSFARSDMLTRHMRLHTGIKPYTCRVCGQVFSRSDHLSTHQRTHTGEKPYRCPQCPYAACRRDMITRHMRTHARYEAGSIAGSVDDGSGGGSDSPRGVISPAPLSPSQALSSLSVHSPSPSSPPEPMDND